METRLLNYFLEIARTGNVSQAARELHVTQPTLSRQLRILEDELGTKLFEREKHKMVLTKAGSHYQTYARQILTMVDRAEVEINQLENEMVGTISIGCIESNAADLMAKAIKKFHQQYPAVKFEMYDLDGADIQEQIDQGLLDLGIILYPNETTKYNSIALKLRDYWGVVLSKKIPLTNKMNLNVDDLKQLPLLVTRNSIMQSELSKLLGVSLSDLNIIGTQNLVTNSLRLAANEVAYPICASGAFAGETSELKFLRILGSRPIYHQLIFSKQRNTSEVVDKFIEVLSKIGADII